jgi:hypothetical protein
LWTVNQEWAERQYPFALVSKNRYKKAKICPTARSKPNKFAVVFANAQPERFLARPAEGPEFSNLDHKNFLNLKCSDFLQIGTQTKERNEKEPKARSTSCSISRNRAFSDNRNPIFRA